MYDAQVQLLALRAIPFIWEPSGTMGANGAFTRGTSLGNANAYANAFSYFAAGAVYPNSPAGWYFTQSTSASAGVVYNNLYTSTSGLPQIPAQINPIVGAGPGSYTGVTGAVTGPQIPINSLGVNSALRITEQWSCANSANNKTIQGAFSGVGTVRSGVLTTSNGYGSVNTFFNRGSAALNVGSQFGALIGGVGILTGTNCYFAANFSTPQNYQMIGNLANATDFLVMEAFSIEQLNG